MDFKRARDAYAVGNVDGVCAELAALFPDDPDIFRLREYVEFAVLGGSIPNSELATTRVLLESIARLTPHHRQADGRSRHYLPKDLDFIADVDGVEGWSMVQALNRIALDNLTPTRRCAVVGTMRDDGIYIMEWVAHYLALGFEHLFIYTNDNADSSDALLGLLARHGIITFLESEVTGEVAPEAKAFGHALHLLKELRAYEWALFVDSDEFLMPAPRYENSIHRVLKAVDGKFPDKGVAGICYDWLWFISDMIFERKPGLLCERFQHARPHWLSKCLVRIRDVQSMRQQHYPEVAPGFLVVDSEFEPIDIASIWERRTAQYGGGRINHYWPRSFQEFAIKKARGATLGGEDNLYDRPFSSFFSWNGYSKPGNAYPTDQLFLNLVKGRLAYLYDFPDVAATAKQVDGEFPSFLRSRVDVTQLSRAYLLNATEPGEL